MRLVEGHDRISDPRRKCRAQARLGQFLDRRQPRHPRVERVCAQGRRRGARHADPRRGGRMGRAARRVQRRQQHHHACRPAARRAYGKVAAAAAKLDPPNDIKLKDPKDWKIAGKPLKRLDTRDKVNGKQVYGIDIKLPGMLIAAIRDCPVSGGKVKSFDAAKVREHARRQEGRAGRRHARRGRRRHLLERQDRARGACRSSGTRARTPTVSSAIDRRHAARRASTPSRPLSATRRAMPRRRIAGAAKMVEAVYSYPYQSHATMEPMNATALYTAEKCEVWCPTQNAEAALAAVAEASGLPVAKCDVYKTLLGGGFGRRGAGHRLCAPGGADREADAGHAGQAAMDARRGHDARLLSPDHAMQAARRARCGGQSRRAAHAHLRAIDPAPRCCRRISRTGWTRPPSRGSTRAAPKARSAITSRTC